MAMQTSAHRNFMHDYCYFYSARIAQSNALDCRVQMKIVAKKIYRRL